MSTCFFCGASLADDNRPLRYQSPVCRRCTAQVGAGAGKRLKELSIRLEEAREVLSYAEQDVIVCQQAGRPASLRRAQLRESHARKLIRALEERIDAARKNPSLTMT